MINHVRTLLLNQEAKNSPYFIGEWPIEESFRPRKLTMELQTIHQILFGNGERLLCNYFADSYIRLINSSSLAKLLTYKDDRLAWNYLDQTYFQLWESYKVLYYNGGVFYPTGNFPEEWNGKVQYEWEVEVQSGGLIRINRIRPFPKQVVINYTLSNNLGHVILPDTDWEIHFTPSVGYRWMLEAVARPKNELHDIWQRISKTSEGVTSAPFRKIKSTDETLYNELNEVWEQHDEWLERFAALLLAQAYATELCPPK